jgi:hypothetical protein
MGNDSHSHGTRQDVSNDTVSKNWEMTFGHKHLVPRRHDGSDLSYGCTDYSDCPDPYSHKKHRDHRFP